MRGCHRCRPRGWGCGFLILTNASFISLIGSGGPLGLIRSSDWRRRDRRAYEAFVRIFAKRPLNHCLTCPSVPKSPSGPSAAQPRRGEVLVFGRGAQDVPRVRGARCRTA
jgi:hypothetical protein